MTRNLNPEIVIRINGKERKPRWTLGALRKLKNEKQLVMATLDFNDPEQVIPFLLCGLQAVDKTITEEDVAESVDIWDMMRFGAQLAKVSEEMGLSSVPLTTPNGETPGLSLASIADSQNESSGS